MYENDMHSIISFSGFMQGKSFCISFKIKSQNDNANEILPLTQQQKTNKAIYPYTLFCIKSSNLYFKIFCCMIM